MITCGTNHHTRSYNGVHKGKHGGRFCWAVAGTLCGGEPQGTFAKKLMECVNCEFLKKVHDEEGRDFVLSPNKVDKNKKA